MSRDERRRVLVVGGYGKVGALIASDLASGLESGVIVAGRDAGAARRVAQRIGRGAGSRVVDLHAFRADDVLDGVGVAIVCVDQEEPSFVEACVERGIHYVDVTASDAFFRAVERLDGAAADRGVSVVLSVGVAPGLSNLLAARACGALEKAQRVDVLVELGLGDQHGTAAIEWTLGRIGREFQVEESGVRTTVRSFGQRARMSFPGERPRWAYRFDISDQHALQRTLGVDAATWLRFSSSTATALLGFGVRRDLTGPLRHGRVRSRLARALSRVRVGSQRCGVAARALAEDGTSAVACVIGREEARMTAAVAAVVARQVLAGELPNGVVHAHQGVDLAEVLRGLERVTPGIVVSLPREGGFA